MQRDHAPTLAEILASPESLQQAALDFALYCSTREKCNEDLNSGIETDADFLELLDQCGHAPASFYKKLCEIGADT